MYLRAVHAEGSIPLLRKFIQENPLGIFTTAFSSPGFPFIQSSHIPWVLDIEDADSETELPRLRGHMARQNPQAKAIIERVRRDASDSSSSNPDAGGHILDGEVLILFNGPVHHYVTPKFYRKTKPESGKVVPTWNYSAVEAYGTAKVYVDHKAQSTQDFLGKQIRDLSHLSETQIMEYEKPWGVDDAPASYVELLAKNIIGIEVQVERLGGKFKMSQEMGADDRLGVIDGFNSLGTEEGAKMAATIKERSS